MIGTRLSHFRIISKLGEGGMGEVYRAEDTKLGREVAIKVLPEAFVSDPERLARFEREAKVLASLNHPHIAGIHEVGEEDGVHFLVMELAPGETLAETLERGPMPLEEALPVAIQIAEALEAAHARGIVHRDLKPANVKIDARGEVKVLDFGLARALEPPPAAEVPEDLARSPTLTYQATEAGVLLGTAAYMSPEQAAGRPVDPRSDVWAFGVVLLEMLTGRRAFEGETVTQVIASVLKDEPDWGSALEEVPVSIAELIRRCLRKDPRRRLQAIGEARVRLEEWLADPAMIGEGISGIRDAGAPPEARPRWHRMLPVGLAVLALAGWLVALWGIRGDSAPSAQRGEIARLALALPEKTGLALAEQDDVIAISRDGRRQAIAVVDEENVRHLALRDLDRAEVRLPPGAQGATSPFFSPDGRWVGYFGTGGLQKVPFEGGPPVTVVSFAGAAGVNRGATWSSDGYIYLTPDTSGGLHRVAENGGSLEPVTELDREREERTHRWPHALPDGEAILFTSDTTESSEYYDDARIEAVRVETGERKVLVEQSSRAQFLSSGHLVFARGGVLFAVPFDSETLAVEGSPQIVLQGVATTEASGAAHFSISRSGDLLYTPGGVKGSAQTPRWLDLETGEMQPTSLREGSYRQLALAPDDRRVALTAAVGGALDLWLGDLERGTLSRLTFEGDASTPVWSPDGKWIAYQVTAGSLDLGGEIYRRRSDGGAEAEPLWPDVTASPLDFTPDGRQLLVARYYPEEDRDELWLLDWEGESDPRPWLETDGAKWMAEISPDGDHVAHISNRSGRPEVYVRPFPGPGGRWQISLDGGFEPRWTPDGRTLFYRWGGTLFRVPLTIGPGFEAGRAKQVTVGAGIGAMPMTFSVTRDGSRILMLGAGDRAETDRVHLVRGWAREVTEAFSQRGG